jgi:predicted MPP superfamily phosphohydrolase
MVEEKDGKGGKRDRFEWRAILSASPARATFSPSPNPGADIQLSGHTHGGLLFFLK